MGTDIDTSAAIPVSTFAPGTINFRKQRMVLLCGGELLQGFRWSLKSNYMQHANNHLS
jgi:hypothetical protein